MPLLTRGAEEKVLINDVNISVVTGTVVDLNKYLALYFDNGDTTYTQLPAYIYVGGEYVNTLQVEAIGSTEYQIHFREGNDTTAYTYSPITYSITITVTAE